MPAVPGALVPMTDALLGAIQGVDRGGVRLAVSSGIAHHSVGGVPQIFGRCGPGDIAHPLGPIAPGQFAVDPGEWWMSQPCGLPR